jgi:hypothetical protein
MRTGDGALRFLLGEALRGDGDPSCLRGGESRHPAIVQDATDKCATGDSCDIGSAARSY